MGALMALLLFVILLTNNQIRSNTPQVAMGTRSATPSKNEESNFSFFYIYYLKVSNVLI